MRRTAILGALVIGMLVTVTAVAWPADAQDDGAPLRTHVADLRTRVAVLETRVAGGETMGTAIAATHTITGDLTLISGGRGEEIEHLGRFGVGGPCGGKGGYADLREGAAIVVADERGTIIATAGLGQGVYTANYDCLFPFALIGVPDAAFYTIEVSHRGGLTYARAELEAIGWEVHFRLGR